MAHQLGSQTRFTKDAWMRLIENRSDAARPPYSVWVPAFPSRAADRYVDERGGGCQRARPLSPRRAQDPQSSSWPWSPASDPVEAPANLGSRGSPSALMTDKLPAIQLTAHMHMLRNHGRACQ